MERWQKTQILKDLEKKIVLLAGPRQAGKTWLAKDIGHLYGANTVYLNYDRAQDRTLIHAENWLESTQLLILDELHKMPEWKNYLKGIFDTKTPHLKILVTGSARLETLEHMGDSLAGRFFLHHLLPFSPAELTQLKVPVDLDRLITRSGFPEPYLADEELDANRWREQYSNSLLALDALEFGQIQDIRALKLIFELLQYRVGSPVSFKSIAEDVGVSPSTVTKYVQILESLYVIFRVTPYSKNIARSLLKEPKIYFFDTELVKGNEGCKFENFVATCLLKHVYAKKDYVAENFALHYLRTKDDEEVDFALIKDNEIQEIIEVKFRDDDISKALLSFQRKYNFQAIQLVKELKRERNEKNIKIVKADHYLSGLML